MSRSKEIIEGTDSLIDDEVQNPEIKTTTENVAEKVIDKMVDKSPIENLSLKVSIEPNKKMGIIRYLQLHPTGNKTLDRTLQKLFGSESHTESEWGVIINNFLNS